MPQSPAPTRQSVGLIALIAGLVLLIVVGPFWVVREANRKSVEAAAIVNHTHEVEATVQALMYDLRNRESATVAYAYGHDSPAIRERLAESQKEIPQNLARLTNLTTDNPEQLLRIGKLGSIIEQRGQIMQTVLAKGAGQADPRDIEWLLDRNPLRHISAEISDTEKALLKLRTSEADELARRSTVATWVAMGLQLLLLGAVAMLLRWQWRNRRVAEAAAVRSSARALSVLQTVREPMAVVDRELRVVLHNPAFREVFAAANADPGTPISAFGNGTWDAPETRQRLADVLARDRELWDHEISHRGEDGRERTLLVNARRMALPDRSDEVALVTANDVTAQKAAELQVRELNRQLMGKMDQVSEVNRELEAFSYSVSHDLRAPLRHIGGFADKLGRHLGDRNDEKSFHYLNTITTSARRMSQLIDDLLVYSRLGRSALRMQPVDMQSVVAETRSMLDANNAHDRPGHRIEWKIAPLPIMVGDENMLRQVWLNLLSNAVKYSGGSDPAVIEVSYSRDDNGDYRFEVADNGVGFDMAYAGKLFGVFQRLHSITEFEGTGIGLASVRRVLARHGGHISADATPGKGARFVFTLPASTDAPQPDNKA
ncbi:ATP-binding protein [Thermomonas carbonis]|uniref:histidine kinase n=1 Tax=Thermomonas carbonis TaxID=1463158 RepID=A0A7G9SS67_9GAMM|nr:ATP-binding protein [Thermomonas carbonis]QNN70692.1 CHASE3 domain-containing protein [Thermomonas carbonis]GHC01682.1 sensor histidine kinase [Thermomonas carbonis]